MADVSVEQDTASDELVVRRGRARRVALIASLAVLAILVAAAIGLWLARRPIAENYVENELARRGVRATYSLDRVGLRTQQISNLVLGDPADPDLVAPLVQVQMRVGLSGSVRVYRIVARGVRLKGRLVGSRVSWGELDKLLPPPSGQPFRLPNVSVEVIDSSIALGTSAGPIGIAVEGSGNLVNGFKGIMAVAGRRLVPGACQVDRMRAAVAVEINHRRPRVVGPLSADRLACPLSRMAMDQMRFDVDSSFSEAFGSFDGHGRLAVASLTAGTSGMAHVTGDISFQGTPAATRGAIKGSAQQARLAQIVADRTAIDGRYFFSAARGELAVVSDYDSASVALAPAMMAGITGPLLAAKGSPVGPIGAAIAAAVRRGGQSFDSIGTLRMVNFPGGGAVRIERADVRAQSGARVRVSGGDGITYYWPSNRLRLDGRIETAGGGLPRARIALRQPRGGGAMSGTAEIAPYQVGSTRLAAAPVRFRALRDGSTAFATEILLDGPIPNGQVRGLRLPVDGSLGARGGFLLGRGCRETGFAGLAMGSLRLGAARLRVCPDGPAIAWQQPGGPTRFAARLVRPRLGGRLGSSPMTVAAESARLGNDGFAAAAVALRLGRAEAPVLIAAERLAGAYAGSGSFAGGQATIGRVPLLLSNADGRWRWNSAGLAVDGGLTLSDRTSPAKFYPLRGDNVRFTLAGDQIRTTGSLHHPGSGIKVSDVRIAHRLSTGAGEAILDVPGLRFGEQLQPEELTRLTEGVIALVVGEIRGQGRIAWRGETVTSSGEFATADLDLAAPFGPVQRLSGTIRFTDLLNLQTAPGQTLRMASVNPGILVEDGVLTYQLLPGRLIKVEGGRWPFMGGELILRETIIDFGQPSAKRLTFQVVGLDASLLVASFGFREVAATGIFDGVLPMIFDESGGRIVGGRLDARPGGGTVAYNGVVNRAQLGMVGEMAFNALKNLRYRQMIVRLDGDLAGEFVTRLMIDQVGLGNSREARLLRAINRVPFKFNVTIRGPFRALIATAKSWGDPRTLIGDVLPGPLDRPGLASEVRRREEDKAQSQTPVDQKVDLAPPPASETER